MYRHDLRAVGLLTLALNLFLQACVPSGARLLQPEPVVLKVNAPPFLSMAPLFIAQEEGLYAEQGLEVVFSDLYTVEAIPALGQGQIDVAAGLIPVNVLNSMVRGSDTKIVADRGYLDPKTCAADALVVRRQLVEDGALDGPAQMKGLRASVERSSAEEYVVEELLGSVNLTLEDIETVDIPIPSELEALGDGSVDIVPTSEPWVTRMSQAGVGVAWIPFQEVIPDFQYLVVYFGPSLMEEDLDTGRRFMVAYLKAVRQYNEGKTERNLEILGEYTGLDRELLSEACWPTMRNDGLINVESVLDFQAWAVEKGYLDTAVREEQFWDPSFVDYANEVLAESSQ
jgi:NitT/TauT family transport system substrate-binding protein